MKQLRSIALALVVASGLGCKAKSTFVHVVLTPAQPEPTGIKSIELDLALGAQTATTTLREADGRDIALPADTTLLIGSGSGQLTITAIARSVDGKELDRGVTTATVAKGAITEVGVAMAGGKADLAPSGDHHDFGPFAQGQTSGSINLSFINAGYKPTGTLATALGGVGAVAFTLGVDGCAGRVLAPSASCSVGVTFHPPAVGTFAAAVTLTGTPGGTATVAITGTGTPGPQTLTVSAGAGGGTVSSLPAGVSCATISCSASFAYGTSVTLTAAPAAGFVFVGWSNACTNASGTCAVSMTHAQSVTATFVSASNLLLFTSGAGAGAVSASPAGSPCGPGCQAYPSGASVVVTATENPGSRFSGWSDACAGASNPCTINVSTASKVTANFVAVYPVTVTTGGTGTGNVKSNESAAIIDCGNGGKTCTAPYDAGSTVTLTATAGPNSVFIGWSGGCSGAGPCSLVVSGPVDVSARFDPSFTTKGTWMCANGVNCQDVYEFAFGQGAVVTIQVSGVTGSSVTRLAAFGPGVPLNGANLLTGLANDRACVGANLPDTVTFGPTVATGLYNLAVGRDWSKSAGATGNYTLTVTSDQPFALKSNSLTVASQANATQCGYTFTAADKWACGPPNDLNCQDVFDFTSAVATPITVTATPDTSSASVVRLAVFDGQALNGINQLNNNSTDRMCVAQSQAETATTKAPLAVGLHRVAVGRDWNTSAGAGGNYTVTITTPDAPLSPLGNTVDDGPSAFGASPTGTSCPP